MTDDPWKGDATLLVSAVLEYQGERVTVHETHRHVHHPPLDEEVRFVEFDWHEGNMSCDCNRSLLARASGVGWPEMGCAGAEIALIDLCWKVQE